MLTANVNLSPTTARRSLGVFWEASRVLRRSSQGFHTICFTMLSKQNISVSPVLSIAKNVNLYLGEHEPNMRKVDVQSIEPVTGTL
jgi:hypothetical protein